MLENLSGYQLILASNSPRRNELLSRLGVSYSVRTLKNLDESYPSDLKTSAIARYVATKKAEAYRQKLKPSELLLTADTIVCKENEVLGKPADREEAVNMLQLLAGGSHWVYTGVCLTSCTFQRSFVVGTEVVFSPLTADEIDWYVDNYKPFDKAGAYGVQEWIGLAGVERISGSYFNVMGLPVHELYAELKKVEPLSKC
ncbi:MAG: Maf family nucleotide pyrophosphatase [Bacteroidota bacterium]|nr:Maf family nucleotide pyrophosphatase [Bacteroidota bacterium]